MRIDVFCEWGDSYGLGHLRRCENLIELFVRYFHHLKFQISFHALPAPIPDLFYEFVIIDSYILEKSAYQFLDQRSKCLICLDDFHRLSYPSKALILSPTALRSKRFSGIPCVILNPVFLLPPSTQTIPNQVLITLGGSDQNTLITQILDALPSHFTPKIISPTFKHPQSSHNLSSHEICTLIDESEYVICAGGGTLNEVISRNKKIIALCIAPNQKPQLNAYKKRFPIIFNPHHQLSHKLSNALARTQTFSTHFGSKLPKLFSLWLHQYLSLPPTIKLFQHLTHYEKKQILSLRNQPEVRQASFNPAPITLKEHLRFIDSIKPNQMMYFAFFEGRRIIGSGSLHLIAPNLATLGIYKDMRCKQAGSKILFKLLQIASKLDIQTLELKVLKTNTKAIAFYQKHHFCISKEYQDHFIMHYQKETK
ncbi:GNAT family N-acetyltransferase [Helicobacter pametensis]|uniref:GNAT family N-acetyltransferase n=1 Tax=Helicobacter pametensis TaxID=95149 RepID=UPI0004BB54FC|nr:GNAT family N-acetyltransferase [Helicobacter pametensis]